MFEDIVAVLSGLDRAVSDAERVEQISGLERLKAACAAAQARVTADLAESQEQVAVEWRARARECADASDFEGWVSAREEARRASAVSLGEGPARGDAGRRGSRRHPGATFGVAGQVALARRESPTRGSRHLTLALALVRHLPRTLAALTSGTVSEWRAEIVVRELGVLSPEQLSAADAELFGPGGADEDEIAMLGDRELTRRVRAIAYRVDAESVMRRSRGEEQQRRVSIRPAPDTMSYVTAYLPVAQGVAVHAALTAAAATARASGDERGKGQLMADLLVQRVTGQSEAAAVPVEVQVVITDRALLAASWGERDETPAHVPGYGTVPAAWARDLLSPATPGAGEARVWLRRLYTHPADGTLVAMDSQRRTFTGGLRRFLITRDGTCTTPWCDAPIAHLDHTVPHAEGGPTSVRNGRGTCVRCNLTKEHPGWSAHPADPPKPGAWRTPGVTITTPTGHRYAASAPPVIAGRPRDGTSLLDRHWSTILAVA